MLTFANLGQRENLEEAGIRSEWHTGRGTSLGHLAAGLAEVRDAPPFFLAEETFAFLTMKFSQSRLHHVAPRSRVSLARPL